MNFIEHFSCKKIKYETIALIQPEKKVLGRPYCAFLYIKKAKEEARDFYWGLR